jgi:menaquinone-dependent protoporphyrinogen oxidase
VDDDEREQPAPTVMVAVATRHGSTREIAEEIAAILREQGLRADLHELDGPVDLDRYDAVVVGSAVYVGRWLEPARRFVARNRAALAARPTWLFSSGPVGDPPRPDTDAAVQIDALLAATRARGHRLFLGRLDSARLGLAEKAVLRVARTRDGDYRDWAAVRDYAHAIAFALAPRAG